MASDFAWGFAASTPVKSWSPDPEPGSNRKDQLDGGWEVESLSQPVFESAKSVDASTQVNWTTAEAPNSPKVDQPATSITDQNVHEPFLCYPLEYRPGHRLVRVPVRNERGSKGYAEVWLQQPGNSYLFGVRLIGDGSTPHLFSSLAPADLALYTNWGMSRVQEHKDTEPLTLVLPVLTDPAVLQEALKGLHSGTLSMSWQTAEAVLVMANSIGVSAFEVSGSRLHLQVSSSTCCANVDRCTGVCL